MENHNQRDVVRKEFTVALTPEKAFEAFVHQLNDWWPREYTWSQETLEAIVIEPKAKGRCYERGPHGFECDWGRTLRCEPGERLVFTWQISPRREPVPDPDKASEVEVRFFPEGAAACRIDFQHRLFSRHGKGAEEYFHAMDSQHGWDYILSRYIKITESAYAG